LACPWLSAGKGFEAVGWAAAYFIKGYNCAKVLGHGSLAFHLLFSLPRGSFSGTSPLWIPRRTIPVG